MKFSPDRRATLIAAASAVALFVVAAPAAAQKKYGPGVTDTEIKLGQTMPYSGPASAYGTIGFNLSYQAEGVIYAKYLLKEKPNAKVAILYQNDDYGKDLLKGVKDGLGANGAKMIVAEATYEVTDPTVDSQIVTLQGSGADTFIDITTPKFAAQAIRKAYDSGWKPLHIINNVGASVGSVLVPAGLDKSTGLQTLQYYKDPNDPQWKDDPAMLEWRAFMGRYYREGDPKDAANVYAYLAAQTMVQVLKQCGNDLTRENVMKQVANIKSLRLPLLLPGMALNSSLTDFALVKQGQLARFTGTLWQGFGEVLSTTD